SISSPFSTASYIIFGSMLFVSEKSNGNASTRSSYPSPPHPFYERVGEGYDDLVEAFPFDFSDTKSIDPNIMYDAVEKGDVDLVPGFTTDSRIEKFDLVTTEDDKDFFPMYDAVPIIRKEALEDMPELEDAINKLAGE